MEKPFELTTTTIIGAMANGTTTGLCFDGAIEQRAGQRNRSVHTVDVAHMDGKAGHLQYDYTPAKILGFVKVGDDILCIVNPGTYGDGHS
jgi:hypothetical protein